MRASQYEAQKFLGFARVKHPVLCPHLSNLHIAIEKIIIKRYIQTPKL
jgi:hypothetical protein